MTRTTDPPRPVAPVDPPLEQAGEPRGRWRARLRAARADKRRRPLAAGHAILIALIAFAVAALLNAPGLHKTAETQSPGWTRDVALAITGPLAGVSHFFHIDGPREGIKAALGRSGDDKIVTSTLIPRTRASAAAGPVLGPPKPTELVFTRHHKLSIWVAGDSLSIVPGLALLQDAGSTGVIRAVSAVDGHLSTGLARPDVFNWFQEIHAVTQQLDPKAVIFTFGANDDQGITGIPNGGTVGEFGSPSWIAEYRRRVAEVMDAMSQDGRYVFWVGLPIARDPAESHRFRVINRIVEQEAANRPEMVSYIDTYQMFEDRHGHYADYLPDAHGQLQLVRAPDGVHYGPAGGELVARAILRSLHRRFVLGQPAQRAPAATSTSPPQGRSARR